MTLCSPRISTSSGSSSRLRGCGDRFVCCCCGGGGCRGQEFGGLIGFETGEEEEEEEEEE